jgi:LL-diaminopimelate aminotransferase
MTTPGYPVAGTHTKYLGGLVYTLPLIPQNNFLPDLTTIPEEVLRKTKMLVLNYPNSPTGALATKEFFESVVEFAHTRKIAVIHDAAHIMLTYKGERPVSFLETPGALDIGIELHSMSKGFDMIGWRLGFVAGNEKLVRAFADVKDNTDSGQNIAIQKAAAVALNDPEIPKRIQAKYKRRLEKLVATLSSIGFNVGMPGGTYFLYTKAPTGIPKAGRAFNTAEDASQYLIREHSISTVPWDDAGKYLRFSTTYKADSEADEDNLMNELKNRLSGVTFSF